MDHGYSGIKCFSCRLEFNFFTVKNNLACVFCVNTHDNFHESRFSCTIFTHQCVELTWFNTEFCSFQYSYSGESFINSCGFQYIFASQDFSPPSIFYSITRSGFSEKCFRITIGSVVDGFVITTPSFAAFSVTKYSSCVSCP